VRRVFRFAELSRHESRCFVPAVREQIGFSGVIWGWQSDAVTRSLLRVLTERPADLYETN
jgi:hypothetical protein